MLRNVDPNTFLVQDDLISFCECIEGITGSSVAKESFEFDLGKLLGQSYDGAGNMAGTIRDTAALIVHSTP